MATFRPAAESVEQDWSALANWLRARGVDLDLAEPPRQFAGGLANLNYLVVVDGAPAVLRRPPDGPMAEGANDMAREWRVLSALGPHFPLAPKALHFEPTGDVLGAPFQILEFREGVAVRARLPEPLAARPDVPARLLDVLVGAMADLHRLDPDAVGLGDLGRPEGFLRRQVEGWARRAAAAYGGVVPEPADAILTWLRGRDVVSPRVSLVHGDLKLDNVLLDLTGLRPVAIVDWDMTTRGDPLFDLGVSLSYWIEAGDPADLHDLQQTPSLEPGFPTRRDIAERYLRATGYDDTGLAFVYNLARLRLAIVWQQLYRLYERGALTDGSYARFPAIASTMLSWTADTLTAPPI